MNESTPVKTASTRTWMILYGSLLGFMVLAFLVYRHQIIPLDQVAASFVRERLVTRGNTGFFFYISYLGSTGFLFPAYLLVFAVCIIRRKYLYGLLLGISGGSVFLISNGLKEFFQRPRPLNPLVHAPTTFSFPSGHSSSGMTFYLLCAFLILKLKLPRPVRYVLAVLLFTLAMLIGFSRIYLGMHYLSDVLGGFCLSFFWLACMHLFYQQLQMGQLANFASLFGQDRKV